ncbi:hypothetical protein ACQKDB_17210 [Planococcus kocurii]|uniref:hypothetical protein n=1 Tax=Planococcus kocurii TaxID=1374 RepID=UPI003D01681A
MKTINFIADGMHFLPFTFLVFILLIPTSIRYEEWDSTLSERLIFQVVVMSAVMLPVLINAIGREIKSTSAVLS